jgi:hypothetical protein
MSEKQSLNIEDFIDSAFKDREPEGSYCFELHRIATAPGKQEQASHKSVIDLGYGETPDGGLRAWLVAFASVRG